MPEKSKEPRKDLDRSDERQRSIEMRRARREVKKLEKRINQQYRDIQDLERQKLALSKDLEKKIDDVKGNQSNVITDSVKAVLSPVTSIGKVGKYFLFGVKDPDVQVQEEAEELSSKEERVKQELGVLTDQITLKREQIKAQKAKMQALYDAHEKLQGEGKEAGVFQSILIFPKNLFSQDQHSKDFKSLERLREKNQRSLVELQAQLEAIDVEIKAIEQQLAMEEKAEMADEKAADLKKEELDKRIKKAQNQAGQEKEELNQLKTELQEKAPSKVIAQTIQPEKRELKRQLREGLASEKKLRREIELAIKGQDTKIRKLSSLYDKKAERIQKLLSKYENKSGANIDKLVAAKKDSYKQMDLLQEQQNDLSQMSRELKGMDDR